MPFSFDYNFSRLKYYNKSHCKNVAAFCLVALKTANTIELYYITE